MVLRRREASRWRSPGERAGRAKVRAEGDLNAPFGGIALDFSHMDKVVCVNAADMDGEVEAGIKRKTLNESLRDTGLFFPVDPGADATLGGMAATRASGTCAVRYGTMRENGMNITAALADGEAVKTGQRARKSAAGYDLTRLIVGSEGTLGIITQLTLRLHGIPEASSPRSAPSPSLKAPARQPRRRFNSASVWVHNSSRFSNSIDHAILKAEYRRRIGASKPYGSWTILSTARTGARACKPLFSRRRFIEPRRRRRPAAWEPDQPIFRQSLSRPLRPLRHRSPARSLRALRGRFRVVPRRSRPSCGVARPLGNLPSGMPVEGSS